MTWGWRLFSVRSDDDVGIAVSVYIYIFIDL